MRPPKTRQSAIRTPLNRILGTEAKVRLLRILSLETEPLTRSELGRRAAVEGKGAHLAASRLEREGVLKRVGTGPRQQVQLEQKHPLADAITSLFRAERARVERLIERLKAAAEELSPELDAAWMQGPFARAQDRPGDPVVLGVLSGSAVLARVVKVLPKTLSSVEADEDITIEVKGYTRPDLAVAQPDEVRELAKAIPIFGPPPSAFTKGESEVRTPRNVVTHSDRDRELAHLAYEVAKRLIQDPGKLQTAKRYVEKRLKTASPSERGEWEEWQAILDSTSPSRLEHFLRDAGDRATRLRQTFPFLNVFSPEERDAILAKARTG